MKRIVLTGGGTAGHVTPNIALIPKLQELGYDITYIGSKDGIEKKLITELGIKYYGISSGKLRRYASIKNLSDPFKVLKGSAEAKRILAAVKPNVVFSKGGFVSVPVVRAAKRLRIPAVLHESDMTPGLANKLCISSCEKICCNFTETRNYLPSDKAVVTGTPIRSELLNGNAAAAKDFCGFTNDKPVILIVGGSLGAVAVNEAVRKILPGLLDEFNIIHLCGNGKVDDSLTGTAGYMQYEYIKEELADMFALASIVISRAGANAICEISALAKPNILIPLSAKASRGDQILNAASFEKAGFSKVIHEEDLSDDTLLRAVKDLYNDRETYISAMRRSPMSDSINKVIDVIQSVELPE